MTKTDKFRGLHVEATSVADKFVWVIKERLTPDDAVEVAASLQSYDKPSEAYRAGETALRGMVRMAASHDDLDDAGRLPGTQHLSSPPR